MKRKVYALITYYGRMLVFRHRDFPDVGVQVPGGTVEPGEDTAVAALREAQEETGLSGLVLVAKLGEDTLHLGRYGRDETIHRTFYHLRCTQPPPETWQHAETNPSEGDSAVIWFSLYWVELSEAATQLAADVARFLDALPGDS